MKNLDNFAGQIMPNITANHVSEMNRNNVESFSFILALFFCIFFVLFFRPVPTKSSCDYLFDNKININTASSSSLVRLSGIGIVRAEAIVNYRESRKGNNESGLVFTKAEDLKEIKGIGDGIVSSIREWLKFE